MIYGLYLSATGVVANSYRQDVIANNLANSETVGFQKDLALIQQRPTAAHERGIFGNRTDPMLEAMGGGMLLSPTQVDSRQGDLEHTGNNLDLALQGKGYFAVSSNGKTNLTRNGQFLLNNSGALVMSNDVGQHVLDANQAPIFLKSTSPVIIAKDGTITQDSKAVGRVGLFDVADESKLTKQGGTMLAVPAGTELSAATPSLYSQFIEHSNVDPANELADLMDAQRQLEANANMIKAQDETLDKLVNDVGKIS